MSHQLIDGISRLLQKVAYNTRSCLKADTLRSPLRVNEYMTKPRAWRGVRLSSHPSFLSFDNKEFPSPWSFSLVSAGPVFINCISEELDRIHIMIRYPQLHLTKDRFGGQIEPEERKMCSLPTGFNTRELRNNLRASSKCSKLAVDKKRRGKTLGPDIQIYRFLPGDDVRKFSS